jgi:NtrC-family two-component system sensor histidine kinase KinB
MKISIRTKFILGIVFFFVIILALLSLSTIHINRLAKKTDAIFKDNHLSVIYAREMSDGLTVINQEVTNSFLLNKSPDSDLINKTLNNFNKTLQLEKGNITEQGEGKLTKDIESSYNQFRSSIISYTSKPVSAVNVIYLHKEFSNLTKQILQLSLMNEKPIEYKTNDAKASANNALTQLKIIGSFCLLIVLSFTFSFSIYFNQRFSQLYNGIKEIGSSNYGHRLHYEGKDEFYEISLVFNEMAEKLSQNKQDLISVVKDENDIDDNYIQVQELKRLLERMQSIEEQAVKLISRLENKK